MTQESKLGRPWWMINGAPEPLGDVYVDRLFNEWIRLEGSSDGGDASETAGSDGDAAA